MRDPIERQAAIDALIAVGRNVDSHYLESERIIYESDAVEAISMLSPAQPERKMGKWIVGSEFEDCRYAKCNQCKVTQVFYYNKPLTNFCPNCGADMRGEQDEQ